MTRKTAFLEGWSWFKFNNLGLSLGANLKFCTSVTKRLKLKVRKFWGPNPTFVDVTGEKLVGGPSCPPSRIRLTRYFWDTVWRIWSNSFVSAFVADCQFFQKTLSEYVIQSWKLVCMNNIGIKKIITWTILFKKSLFRYQSMCL